MQGAITGHLDAVQIVVAIFFLGFGALVFYLRREDKREGYPLVDVSPRGVPIQGFPEVPPPKRYRLLDGSTTQVPHVTEPSAMRAEAPLFHLGRPLIPIGDPVTAEVGPGAYPLRIDHPFQFKDEPQVRPMRATPGWRVAPGDVDPRGLPVVDAARQTVGSVVELWVDRGVKLLRYLEVRLDGPEAPDAAPEGAIANVLVPIYHTDVGRRRVALLRIHAGRLQAAPRTRDDDRITAREEDMITAYFAAVRQYGGGSVGAAAAVANPAPRFPG